MAETDRAEAALVPPGPRGICRLRDRRRGGGGGRTRDPRRMVEFPGRIPVPPLGGLLRSGGGGGEGWGPARDGGISGKDSGSSAGGLTSERRARRYPPREGSSRGRAAGAGVSCWRSRGSSWERRIEAVATTRWFGFRDDIVIRISPAPNGGSVLDIRSVSRVGLSDIGTNARRIRTFLKTFSVAAKAGS